MLEESKRRDHRVLGKQLDLFTTNPMVGPGLILWLPKGATIRGLLGEFLKEELARRGYEPVYTPNIARVELYQISGHYPYYADSQFKPIVMSEDEKYLLKPMNCPHHIMIYKSKPRSYRDLPVRLAEFGTVYRYEQSGELGGMTRVRGFHPGRRPFVLHRGAGGRRIPWLPGDDPVGLAGPRNERLSGAARFP